MKKIFNIILIAFFLVSLALMSCSSGGGGSSDSGGGSANPTAKWYVAKGAPSSAQGVDGDLYLDQDAAVLYVKTGGQWVTAASLRGAAGNGWLFGSGAPGASLGADGDLYLDTASTMTYRKYGGAWTSMFALQGAAGAAGADGAAWFTGTVDPTSGVPAAAKAGDFYLNTQTTVIWKKDGSGSWSSVVMFQAAGTAQFAFTPQMDNYNAQYFSGIAYGNGKYVAVGVYGTIAVSSDGMSWTMTNHYGNYSKVHRLSRSASKGLVDDLGSEAVKSNLNDIAYGNGVFVAVGNPYDYGTGDYASFYTSTNGTTWNYTTSTEYRNGAKIAFANGLFLAAVDDGSQYLLYTSPNGTTWTQRTLPWQCYDLSNAVYGNGKFLVVGDDGDYSYALSSTDGVTWVQEASQFEDDAMSIYRIAYGNGVFVAIGTNGNEASALWNSVDGIHWYSVELPIDNIDFSYDAVNFGNGFVVLGYVDYQTRAVLTSSNGISWTYGTWPSRYFFTDAAWGPLNGGTFVISLGEYYNP